LTNLSSLNIAGFAIHRGKVIGEFFSPTSCRGKACAVWDNGVNAAIGGEILPFITPSLLVVIWSNGLHTGPSPTLRDLFGATVATERPRCRTFPLPK
jgi:hypothetical protein